MKNTLFLIVFIGVLLQNQSLFGQTAWYTQGDFVPKKRITLTLKNSLNFDRKDVPIAIPRSEFSYMDFYDFEVTIVDPTLEPRPQPSIAQLGNFGVHEIRKETNGRMIFHQLDDLDKDGIWDELYFISDLKANETKTIYLYMGVNNRGWNPYTTAATMGSYVRHVVPFWENEYVGWKLWYPADCDVYGKRTPQLITQKLSINNLDGYGVPYDMGSDIMSVGVSLGGGGIVVFEDPKNPQKVARPRFTPAKANSGLKTSFNVGQFSDTRYSFDIVVNGPLRSMVKVRTFNWKSEGGFYELEQVYTAYTRQNYSTCQVKFNTFKPNKKGDAYFGCGIKKHPSQVTYYQNGNIVVTGGPEEVMNPDDAAGVQSVKKLIVDYISTACIVKKKYQPQLQVIKSDTIDNYAFKIKPTKDMKFEYMIGAAWSEGPPFKTNEDFKNYMIKTEIEYENPVLVGVSKIEAKL
jgi:Domain of unknown function (DUF4861)